MDSLSQWISSIVFAFNISCNTCIPDSTLKKKNHVIAYHFVREGVAREEWVTGYIKSENNAADTLTKTIPAGERDVIG